MDKRAFDDAFGPPKTLTDDQIARLQTAQAVYMTAATALLEIIPSTPDREKALSLLRDSKQAADAAIRYGRSILTREVLADLVSPIQAEDKLVSAIWLNALDFADILKSCTDIFDAETKREVLQTGVYGVLWNMKVCVSRKIPAGMAKLVVLGEEWAPPTDRDAVIPASELVRIH